MLTESNAFGRSVRFFCQLLAIISSTVFAESKTGNASLDASAGNGRFTVIKSDEWRAADMHDTVILPRSALDLANLIPSEPAGTYGRVIVNRNGKFGFEKKPDADIVFWGCSLGDIDLNKRKSKEEMRALADAIHRQGYNLVRPHFLDHYLMKDSKADFDFDMERLDLFDYFVFCLKEHGIYLYFDAVTSPNGYKKGSGELKDVDLKKEIIVFNEVREHWRLGVTKLLTHVNPYTKTTLADDPVVAVLLFYNELEFYTGRNSGPHPALVDKWRSWLKQRYNNDLETLAKAYQVKLKPGTTFENLPLYPYAQWGTGAYAADLGTYLTEIETKLASWFEKTIRAIGYGGLTTQWDMGKLYRSIVARADTQVISMHNYFGHPTAWLNRGSNVDQESSLGTAGQYWRTMAATRFIDRPFMITEYSHCFWSRTRYEEGILCGAYSALQGFQGLMVHASPVCIAAKAPFRPFDAGSDPVERANQVMSAFLFARRDVSPSQSYIELSFDDKFLRSNMNLSTKAYDILSLISGFGVWYDGAAMRTFGVKPKPAAVVNASGGAQVSMTSGTMDVMGNAGADKETAALVMELKKQGLIPAGNRSDPDKGIYHSDTGEILMESGNNTMTVITPRFEGIASDKTAKRALGSVTGIQSDIPSSAAVISLDGLPLAKSSRMLLVYNTDALNSGMELSNDRRTLYSMGGAPTLIRTGSLKVELQNENAAGLEVWALAFNGKRVMRLPCSVDNGRIHITINTAKLENGPTPFFEITVK